MPITADRFDELEEDSEPKPGTNADVILQFLESHRDQAFTQSEIRTNTGIPEGSVGPTLVRLRQVGLVDHKEPYWRLSDHAESVDAAVRHGSKVAAETEETPFDREEWAAFAEDPRENRE